MSCEVNGHLLKEDLSSKRPRWECERCGCGWTLKPGSSQAVALRMIRDMGVKCGDAVAAGLTGSNLIHGELAEFARRCKLSCRDRHVTRSVLMKRLRLCDVCPRWGRKDCGATGLPFDLFFPHRDRICLHDPRWQHGEYRDD